MRVLCTWELGASAESMLQLRRCAQALREHFEGVEIILATEQDIAGADVSWADRYFSAPSVRVRTTRKGLGYWRHFHAAGWTAPAVRQSIYSNWSLVFREFKPDLVLACASPSALLVSVLEDVRVIQVGNGMHMPTDSDWPSDAPFPEFLHWLHFVTGRTLNELLNKPGLVFNARALDKKRNGLFFHVDPLPETHERLDADVLAVWDDRHYLSDALRERGKSLWGDRFLMVSPARAWKERITTSRLSPEGLLIGHYDPYWLTRSLSAGLPYMGSALHRAQGQIASRVQSVPMIFEFDETLGLLDAYHEAPEFFIRQTRLHRQPEHHEFSSLDSAIEVVCR